ncbi:hypothetical protein [Nocardia camponoti]|uniref:hypothetical protein n=1 Tax=Nocardia camponoti TaxID=1616106 RepID=UPI0016638DB7|nr:hypothetical protein [Nocardia camponoti]
MRIERRIEELVAQADAADTMNDFLAARLIRDDRPADVSQLPEPTGRPRESGR